MALIGEISPEEACRRADRVGRYSWPIAALPSNLLRAQAPLTRVILIITSSPAKRQSWLSRNPIGDTSCLQSSSLHYLLVPSVFLYYVSITDYELGELWSTHRLVGFKNTIVCSVVETLSSGRQCELALSSCCWLLQLRQSSAS